MRPDLQLLNKHIQEARFQIGIDECKWDVVNYSEEGPLWPFFYAWVSAAPRANAPEKFFFRFELTNYNILAPSACPWDMDNDCILPPIKWPKGSGVFANVFRTDWQNGTALYAPCDRFALQAHAHDWPSIHQDLCWKPSLDSIDKYLVYIRDLLNSKEYYGV